MLLLVLQANERDINAAMTSSFLCEDPATTVSASNPNRPVPYHFKGLPTEYRQYVLDTQMQQAQAGQMKKQQESQSDQAFDQYFQQQVRANSMPHRQMWTLLHVCSIAGMFRQISW